MNKTIVHGLLERGGEVRCEVVATNVPRRFLQGPAEFVAANSVFRIGDAPHGYKPSVESQRGILEDGPDLGGSNVWGWVVFVMPQFYMSRRDESSISLPKVAQLEER